MKYNEYSIVFFINLTLASTRFVTTQHPYGMNNYQRSDN